MRRVEIDEFLGLLKGGAAGFDVRTPAEFEKGHIPGVLNLPLLSNEERVVVGTTYKQEGRHPAILAGLQAIGPRMHELVEQVQDVVGHPNEAGEVLVHCWRGGMRSGSVAWLLELYGYQVVTLEKGYKGYRRWALDQLENPPPMVVVGGCTGSGKTEILHALRENGELVIDLEGLANHRGSAFGALELPEQPSQEHFENLLAWEFARFRGEDRRIWVEDEGRMIGIRSLSNDVLGAIRSSQLIYLEIPFEQRVQRLVRIYGEASTEGLADSFNAIRKRLGNQRTDVALEDLHNGDLSSAAATALEYYDGCYEYGLTRREGAKVHRWAPQSDDVEGIAAEIVEKAKELDAHAL